MKVTFKSIQILFACWLTFSAGNAYAGSPVRISLVKWSFRTQTGLLCDMANAAGAEAIDMADPDKWDIILGKGLAVAVADGADLGIERGFCNRRWHGQLIANYSKLIPLLAEKGIRQVVCYSGINPGLSSEEALEVCAEGIKPLLEIAEKAQVTLVMELLSSRECDETFTKQRFAHYQCDNPEWGVALCEKLNSPSFKLLYDVWHMSDMGRDVCSDVKKYHGFISHYHIAGIPGRKELSASDRFDYKQFMRLLHKVGYDGFVGLEPDRLEKNLAGAIEQSINILKQK